MKLTHPDWEKQMTWEDGRFPLVILENRACHYAVVQELYAEVRGGRGRFVLSEGERLLDAVKSLEVLVSPWDMDFSGRKVMTAFYARLKQALQDGERLAAAQEAVSSAERCAELLGDAFTLPTAYDNAADALVLMKAIHLRPEPPEGSLAEQMLSYMEFCTELLGTACFVFCGFRRFLPEEELHGLYHTAFLKKLHFLLLENTAPGIVEEEEPFIIDEDLCQIF